MFCDFENIALGVREAKYAQFDMEKVLERLLAKGSIVVKKAYCDWDRYKEFKVAMHAASFELIEIPHVRQSGKNSATSGASNGISGSEVANQTQSTGLGPAGQFPALGQNANIDQDADSGPIPSSKLCRPSPMTAVPAETPLAGPSMSMASLAEAFLEAPPKAAPDESAPPEQAAR